MCDELGISLDKRRTKEQKKWAAEGHRIRKEREEYEKRFRVALLPEQKKPSLSVTVPTQSIPRVLPPPETDAFLKSYEWRKIRMLAIKKYGRACQCCGATGVINVDHIKPRRFFPELALDLNNLQILCDECNHGKGNWDMTDWRPNAASVDGK